MAEIVRARNTLDANRIVAIKRILPHLCGDEHYRAMFMDESRLLTQLNHPSIIRALEASEIDGTPYIALEYVQGQDAREVFMACERAGQPLPLGIACYVMARVCEGLQYVHDRTDEQGRPLGIVHRDVSLQNLLLGYDGEVKVTDFGIAVSEVNEVRTEAGIVKGKFGYMSPEQIRGAKLDRRTDVFSTGICLYELLTGERLFSGENDYKAIERVRQADVPRPSSRNRQIPSSLENIVRKALARNPKDRYPSANELRRALQGFLAESNLFIERADLGNYLQALFEKEYLEAKRIEAREQADWANQSRAAASVSDADSFESEQTMAWTPGESSPTDSSDEQTELLDLPSSAVGAPEPDAPMAGPNQFDMDWDEQEPTTIAKGIEGVADSVAPSATTALQPPLADTPAPRSRRQRSVPTLEIQPQRDSRVLTIALAAASAAIGVFVVVYMLLERGEAGIRIDTDPKDAVVYIDGRRLPEPHSPFIATKLSSREKHTIVVERAGHQSWSSTLKLPPGEIFPLPTVRLEPVRSSEPAPAPAPKPKPKPEPEPEPSAPEPVAIERPAPKSKRALSAASASARSAKTESYKAASEPSESAAKPAPRGNGTLRINSRPWSKVSVDGVAVGNTPLMSLEVAAGTHTITLENPQFGVKEKLTVTVKPGETVTRVVTLKPQ